MRQMMGCLLLVLCLCGWCCNAAGAAGEDALSGEGGRDSLTASLQQHDIEKLRKNIDAILERGDRIEPLVIPTDKIDERTVSFYKKPQPGTFSRCTQKMKEFFCWLFCCPCKCVEMLSEDAPPGELE